MQIARHDLTRLLSQVTRVIQARNTIPILSNVALTVTDGTLTVRGTDLDIEVQASMPIDASPVAFTVDAKMLGDIAKKAGDDLTLELKDHTLTVRSGKSRFRLPTLPVDDFPNLTSGEFTTEFEYDLAALVAPVAFAVSDEANRYFLCGVLLTPQPEGLVAVATNGHRLAKHVGPAVEEFEGIIIPTKLVGLIPKGTVSVKLSDRKIQFATADTIITGKLIDGTYPNWRRVIPRNNSRPLAIDRDALLAASERVSIVSGERGNAVRLNATQDALRLSVANGSQTAEDELTATFEGEFEIGFNSIYIGEALRAFPSGEVNFHFEDMGSPTLLTGGNESLEVVLMSMRV